MPADNSASLPLDKWIVPLTPCNPLQDRTGTDPAPYNAPPKPATSSVSEMLTPSELAQLRQKSKDADAYLQEVYPGLKIQA